MTKDALNQDSSENIKKKAALSSVFWSFFLTCLKLAAGLASNSLGVLSEALHSALDFCAASITFFAVRASSAPADKQHPFGHGKIENISALVETFLLAITCSWIIYEACVRLFVHHAPIRLTWWLFGIIIISLVVDINRASMLHRVAREHRSQALEADAMHFTTDIWSSAVVLLGLACTGISQFLPIESVTYAIFSRADAIAALGVAFIILRVCGRMAKKSILSIMDGGTEEEHERLIHLLSQKVPAYTVKNLRIRQSGSKFFVDLIVRCPQGVDFEEAHGVGDLLEYIIIEELVEAEVIIHMEPNENLLPNYYMLTNRVANMFNIPIHGLNISLESDGLYVFMHIHLPTDMNLIEAHNRISTFEQSVRVYLGAKRVVTHFEPLVTYNTVDMLTLEKDYIKKLECLLQEFPNIHAAHNIHLFGEVPHLGLSLHCRTHLKTVGLAHEQASNLENFLRNNFPDISEFLIHMEPPAV